MMVSGDVKPIEVDQRTVPAALAWVPSVKRGMKIAA